MLLRVRNIFHFDYRARGGRGIQAVKDLCAKSAYKESEECIFITLSILTIFFVFYKNFNLFSGA